MEHDCAVVVAVVARRLVTDALGRIEVVLRHKIRSGPRWVVAPPSADTLEAEHRCVAVLTGQIVVSCTLCPLGHRLETQLIKHAVPYLVIGSSVGRALA